MLPTRAEAEKLVTEAELCNPGPWADHCRVAAHCAEKIAQRCGMDGEKAYVLGLLHDIGRKFGTRHMGHVVDGYRYMLALGYDEVARICLSHSFNNQRLDEFAGNFDVSHEELDLVRQQLAVFVPDEYDRLVQLCDALAGAEGVMDIETRMADVKRRYGVYPQAKWDKYLYLKAYFEEKMGMDVYTAVDKAHFRLRAEP